MPLADRATSALLVVDIQEKFAPHICGWEGVLDRSVRMVLGARELGIPVLVTEQYPKGLGHTVSAIAEALPEGTPVFEKTSFSCLGAVGLAERLEGRESLFVVGIETHVCVLQTVLEALESSLRVHVVRDAVGSRDPANRVAALERMASAGAVVTTSEMALFELLRDAAASEFRAVQRLVK